MTKITRITVPALKPDIKLDLGPENDVHKFEAVARTAEVDEEIDAISAEYMEKAKATLNALTEDDDLAAEDALDKMADRIEMQRRYMNVLLEPADGNTEPAGDLMVRLYQDGRMSSTQIISVSEQVIELSKPS